MRAAMRLSSKHLPLGQEGVWTKTIREKASYSSIVGNSKIVKFVVVGLCRFLFMEKEVSNT